MELRINHLIIHELDKEADDTEAKLFLSHELAPKDERAQLLVQKLHDTFISKSDVLQGYLSSPEDALFPGYFQHMLDQGMGEEAFIAFSRETMNALQLSIQGVVGAKGGYLVYADYKTFEARTLGIFLVRDTEGVVFNKNEGSTTFNLDVTTYLNTDKLAMACRLHLDKAQNGDGRFVELIKHSKSQKEISEYFINWIGLERPESSKELTHTFLEMVSQLPLPVEAASGAPISEGEFREAVVKFAMKSPEKTIDLKKFDQEFYAGEAQTETFLKENDIPLDNEFRFDGNLIRKFNNYRVYAEGIALSFARNHYQRRQIEIDGDKVIIHSPELVEKLLGLIEE
ncbi:MAG: nucleoid-associated protein [Saprospiraceae bacterium]